MYNSFLGVAVVSVLAASGALASPEPVAAPIAAPATTPAPSPAEIGEALEKRAACTFAGSTGYSAASASKADCATIVLSALAVPAGVTLDLTDLADGTEVTFEGATTFAYEEWEGPLFAVSGTSITVTGASGSSLDGNGAQYWDGEGSNGGKTKPKFFQAHDLEKSTISGITITNAPVQVFSINGATTLALTDVTIDNSDGDSLGANTDCFDIGSSTGVTITGAKCYNQDDCVAINSGTSITFTGGYCSGGHGLSIGSVGGRDDNTVSDVTFESTQVVDSQQAVRIKTISGDTGTVKSITYKDITISGATDYGVIITQAYNGDTATTGVPITDLTLSGVTGTVSSDATNIFIDCGSTASCSGWTWDVDVTGGDTSSDCANIPSGASC
ncbi:endopolygalacturonase PGb [Coniella lustricola]|uniref:endo-polygalacturonase n=1 Tax=Coniella lustricola TaxID=2025994 RepID=A0A2T3AGT4_9PEZI|nr:endopolygalacturonase PGb [Coniella lustricola]